MSATSRIYTVHNLPAGKISIMPHPRGGDWLADDIKWLAYASVDILASLLTPDEVSEVELAQEEACCHAQNIIYLSYPIIDRSVPAFSTETFKLLEQLKGYLDAGKHVAVHCFMGLGRSALIAASVLVLSDFSPEQACRTLSDARGYSVPETREQRAWLEELSERYRAYLQAL